ncbi:tRNA nucleotidyltransferase [Psychrobacter sp. I-STPA6b]|uniref:tRNA nucleotidyltransferase n=1 Tax=Psychrobacter sp. I-STPA6b TaxID=2585718 RepID=UPI00222188A3|nr:tRNA nucleotidyltransferase [Psychrobacter sp. I-STPA6b]
MQVYLVGGAVRDKMLGKPIKDRDFVVVGSNVQQMLDAGFHQVGADFPVFLHPQTKEEYALARTERKSGHGYQGFSIYASPEVTLEEDLQRRDLTINAMAIEVHGLHDSRPLNNQIIDPYGGLNDIKDKQLRHVSMAFVEDPLRVLRVARFYARYFFDGFQVAAETQALMTQLANSGELNHLTPERVWQESSRALMQTAPHVYWQILYDTQALTQLCPTLANAWDTDKKLQLLSLTALALSATHHLEIQQRWAILMSSFADDANHILQANNTTSPTVIQDKATTNTAWQSHISEMAQRLKPPKLLTKFALLYARHHSQLRNFVQLSASEQIHLIEQTGAHKDATPLQQLLSVNKILALAAETIALKQALHCFHQVGMSSIDPNLKGAEIGAALTQARIDTLKLML